MDIEITDLTIQEMAIQSLFTISNYSKIPLQELNPYMVMSYTAIVRATAKNKGIHVTGFKDQIISKEVAIVTQSFFKLTLEQQTACLLRISGIDLLLEEKESL